MIKKRRVLAFSQDFQEMFFSKDIFLVPYYIAKAVGADMRYLYMNNMGNTPLPESYRGCSIEKADKNSVSKVLLQDVALKGRQFDILFINGSSAIHMLAVWIYKHVNPRGRVVIFGDMEAPQARELNANGFVYGRGAAALVKGWLASYFFHHSTYLVANTEAYTIMSELCNRKQWTGLLHFYPCLDDELFQTYGLRIPQFNEREKVIICVGRIGNHQKNTEMLLKALSVIDIKDWKIYMIGPIANNFNLNESSDFQYIIDKFFTRHPKYKGKLIFTGPIYDQEKMFEYYLHARILLSTARHEGFANVYSQAAALGCYIISTDVGGADVGSNNWKYGTKVAQEDWQELARILEELVNGKIHIDEGQRCSLEEMCYSYRVEKILLPKMGLDCPHKETKK